MTTARGRIDDTTFDRIQDGAIGDAVKLQEQVGLQVVNDGEFRARLLLGPLRAAPEWPHHRAGALQVPGVWGAESDFTAPIAEAPLRRTVPLAADEVAFLAPITSRTIKVTMPAPSTLHFYAGSGFAKPGLYRDLDAYFADLAGIYRAEIADIARAGGHYIQFDEVALVMLCDPTVRELVRADGLDPAALVSRYVDALNQATEGAPRRHRLRYPYVPRQLQGPLPVERRLRRRGRAAVRARQGEPFPAGIRHTARRRLRAAALSAERQGRGAWAGELEGADPGTRRSAETAS